VFIQHKNLKNLTIPATKVAHLHSAASGVQLAFVGYPPQLCSAYLVWITGNDKSLIVIGFYLKESGLSIFFVPKAGEVPSSQALQLYREGQNFVESMGFVLGETDYHLMTQSKKDEFWNALPITQPPRLPEPDGAGEAQAVESEACRTSREHCLQSLGRFLAAM